MYGMSHMHIKISHVSYVSTFPSGSTLSADSDLSVSLPLSSFNPILPLLKLGQADLKLIMVVVMVRLMVMMMTRKTVMVDGG